MLDAVDTDAGTVTQLCTNCGRDNEIALAGLVLGNEAANPDIIALPLCACGAREDLNRTWDAEPDSPHRRAVNALACFLKGEGRSHSATKVGHDAETRMPKIVGTLPASDITGREKKRREEEASAQAERTSMIREATRAAIVRLGLDQGERPSLEDVQTEFDRLTA